MVWVHTQKNLRFCGSSIDEILLLQIWECSFGSDLDVAGCDLKQIMPIEIFDTSFESTKDTQHYGTKITYIEESKSSSDYNLLKKIWFRYMDWTYGLDV